MPTSTPKPTSSSQDDLISVLMPAYSHEKYVQEAIKSIINQTYKNIELIVIDDGSPDSTWEKIQELKDECKKRFTKLTIKTQKNQGVYNTLNTALKLATGKYVYIADSDDVAKPKLLATLHKFLAKNDDYGLAVGNNEIIDSNSNVVYWDKYRNNVSTDAEHDYKTFGEYLQKFRKDINFESEKFGSYTSLLRSNYIPNGYLMRKDMMTHSTGYTPDAPFEDWYMMMQIAKYGKMKYFNEILLSYRWHGANTISKTERMRCYMKKTFEYEVKNVLESDDKEHIRVVKSFLENSNKKTYLKIGSIIELYRTKNPSYKQYTLKIFGKKFTKKLD
ncbi:MAG: glycosyltransferase [Lactobacillus sp.]|jgi:alpha-1,3-rhamnosyltransferase|nr:glycosyltransferase [Lactobacillus sp.]